MLDDSLIITRVSNINQSSLPNNDAATTTDYLYINSCILGNEIRINDLSSGMTYTYYVFKGQSATEDALLTELSITTTPKTPVLKIEDISSSTVELSWNKINNADDYEIYRDNKLVSTVSGNKTSYKDKKVKSAKTYNYQIRSVVKAKDKKIYSKKDSKTVTTPSILVLPSVSGECKTWANYQAVTAKSSPQYKLLHSSECYTDTETGIRMVGDYYCIALGSYYGTTIGQKYLIKLSSGNEFKAILCDQKSDRHTDSTHRYAVTNKDIIEFYIDKAYKPAVVDGSYGALPQFAGSVVSIEKIN